MAGRGGGGGGGNAAVPAHALADADVDGAAAASQQQRWFSFRDAHGRALTLDYAGAGFPDRLKLIKTVSAFPLPFELTAIGSLDWRTRRWNYHLGARDTLVGGRVTFNSAARSLVYRKLLPFPLLNGLTRPALVAEWRLEDLQRRRFGPRVQLGLAVDDAAASSVDDGATLTPTGRLRVRRKVFVTRRWGFEVAGDAALRLSSDLSGGAGGGAGGGGMSLHATAEELNLLLRI